jgi:hypothetical protein
MSKADNNIADAGTSPLSPPLIFGFIIVFLLFSIYFYCVFSLGYLFSPSFGLLVHAFLLRSMPIAFVV